MGLFSTIGVHLTWRKQEQSRIFRSLPETPHRLQISEGVPGVGLGPAMVDFQWLRETV